MFSSLLYNRLVYNGVKDAFVYSGGAIMPLVDKFKTGEINLINNNHEQNCGHAATGYAKSSGQTGICIVTSGPGLTNLVTPLLDARNDSTPLIAISGQVSKNSIGTNAFQECPAVEITKHVTKWSYQIQENDHPEEIIDRAFKIANSGKPGSVHLDIPKCILSSNNIIGSYNRKALKLKENIDILQKNKHEWIDWDRISEVINASESPILYIGQGCNNDSDLLRAFIKKSNIPVTTTIHGLGVVKEDSPLSLKFLGMHGLPTANFAMQKADCIIALGSRFDDRTTGNISKFAPNVKNIIHVNIEPSEINKVITSNYPLNMTCKYFLENMLPLVKYQQRLEWCNKIHTWREKYPLTYRLPSNNKLNTQMVVQNIGAQINAMNKGYIITTGVGNHQMMAAQFINWKYPKSFLSSGSLGVMGVGLPYAIGAQLANPDRLVLDIDGDGSFNHTLADLQTIVRYNLPIKIAIMNDGQQSMVRAWENLFFNENYIATKLPNNPDYCKLAESYGIPSLYCNNVSNLDTTVNKMLKFKGPVLVNFKVESDICFPLVPPGNGLDEILFSEKENNPKNATMAPS